MTAPRPGRIDFHLHSYASNVTDYYAANSFAIPESYSNPHELHRELKACGMDLVTLTDHNSIDGVRELLDAGLRDVFISAEMTASFPEDGCNIHVTVANVTEAQFAGEAQRTGGNRIAYFKTHPLMSTQNRPYGREGALLPQRDPPGHPKATGLSRTGSVTVREEARWGRRRFDGRRAR